MANFDRAFIDQVLSSTDIVDVIKEKVNLTKNGTNFKGLCPFHSEKTPSFNVSSSKQFYHCFGCGAHGDAIKFIQEHDNLTFIEALTKLAQAAGLELPEKTKKNDTYYNLFISNKLAAEFYSRSLENNSEAKTYLENRGIDQGMIETFHLGLSNNKWDDLTNLFSKEKIINNAIEAGLVIKSNNKTYDRFRNRIMFPIRNSTGNIIGFGARIYNSDDGAKYLNSPETKLFHKSYELYGLYECKKDIAKEKSVIIVEGYTDVIGLYKSDIKNCVATLGTAFTKFHFNKIKRYTNKIIFCFDGDAAGKSAAWKAITNCLPELKDEIQLYLIFLPEGCDPDSYVKDEKDNFDNLINNPMPLSEYIIEHLGTDIDIKTVEGKTSFALEAKKVLNQMPDIMYTDILREKIQQMTGNIILKKNQATHDKEKNTSSDTSQEFDIKELTLLNLLIEYPMLVKEFNCEHIITEKTLINIYNVIREEISKNENFTAAHLLKLFPNNEAVRSIVTFESNEKSEDSARVTIQEIFHQLELSSKEKVYFELLNRYTDGQRLSEKEREFIKNFKK
tara:strand:+ start:1896 stop:3578 length:1683 start_codon:yes stop_codon:yes gene_type:complete